MQWSIKEVFNGENTETAEIFVLRRSKADEDVGASAWSWPRKVVSKWISSRHRLA